MYETLQMSVSIRVHSVRFIQANTEVVKCVINKISNLGIICAVLVVVIHAASFPAENNFDVWWNGIMVEGFCRMAVPYFFIVSGFFLARHYLDVCWYRKAIRCRVKTLLVPFLIWNFIAFVMIYGLRESRDFSPIKMFLDAFGIYPFTWPPCSPLWYVRSLILYVVVSPLLFRGVDKSFLSLYILATLYIYIGIVPVGLSEDIRCFANQFVSVSGMFYFTMGGAFAIRGFKTPCALGWKVAGALFVISLTAFIYSTMCLDSSTRVVCLAVRKLGALVALAGAWIVVPSSKWPDRLVKFAFPLYVLHIFPILLWRHFSNNMLYGVIVAIFVVILIWIVHAVLCFLPSKILNMLYGGRFSNNEDKRVRSIVQQ